jgi:hypothetical protein
MSISGRGHGFTVPLINEAPEEPGVFEFTQYNITTFIGSTPTNLRSALLGHLNGDEGFCTTTSTWVKYEVTTAERAEAYAKELLDEFHAEHGVLPRCNDLTAWEPADPSGRRGGGGE